MWALARASPPESIRRRRRWTTVRSGTRKCRRGEELPLANAVSFALAAKEEPARSHPGEADALTRREREIAGLVTEGNREIAAGLMISQTDRGVTRRTHPHQTRVHLVRADRRLGGRPADLSTECPAGTARAAASSAQPPPTQCVKLWTLLDTNTLGVEPAFGLGARSRFGA